MEHARFLLVGYGQLLQARVFATLMSALFSRPLMTSAIHSSEGRKANLALDDQSSLAFVVVGHSAIVAFRISTIHRPVSHQSLSPLAFRVADLLLCGPVPNAIGNQSLSCSLSSAFHRYQIAFQSLSNCFPTAVKLLSNCFLAAVTSFHVYLHPNLFIAAFTFFALDLLLSSLSPLLTTLLCR